MAAGRISQLCRDAVRQRFEERFTARRMARDYIEVYRSLMEGTKSKAARKVRRARPQIEFAPSEWA
jgi:hypothetical protein